MHDIDHMDSGNASYFTRNQNCDTDFALQFQRAGCTVERLTKLVGQSILIVLITLILLEAALQGIALIVRDHGHNQSQSWSSNNLRVLALGDSNTYGVFLEQEQSYPAQLEKIWNSQRGEDVPPIEVINLGYPGTNSSRVLANMKPIVENLQPDIVLVLVGANDPWTPVETIVTDSEVSTLTWLKNHSRVYRLFYMLRREAFDESQLVTVERTTQISTDVGTIKIENLSNLEFQQKAEELLPPAEAGNLLLQAKKPDMEFGGQHFAMGPQGGKPDGTFDGLAPNLMALKEIAHAHNVRLVLLTYPANTAFYQYANEKLRELSKEMQFDLIDVTEEFMVDCPKAQVSCEQFFFFDGHPRAPGYQRMAQFVADKLKVLLKADSRASSVAE